MTRALGLVAAAAPVAALLTWLYLRAALRLGVLATPNQRSLHTRPTPVGGGAAFAATFLALGGWALVDAGADARLLALLVGGGLVALAMGVADDRLTLPQPLKLATYMGLAAWILWWVGGRPLLAVPGVPAIVSLPLSWLVLVWVMNLYNFVDGIDGMAASGGAFICLALGVALVAGGQAGVLLAPVGVLGGATLGFLAFNWPPARIFMGDAGSLFLGYAFAALATETLTSGAVSPWTWLVIFGYFGGDTTTTTLLRMARTRRFWEGHRSHAYQNLARVTGSHLRVVRGVLLYHLAWLLPLAVLSVRVPAAGPWCALLALGPSVAWTWRWGPRFSAA